MLQIITWRNANQGLISIFVLSVISTSNVITDHWYPFSSVEDLLLKIFSFFYTSI